MNTSPFRSEVEQLREQLRRAEERVLQTKEEMLAMEQRLGPKVPRMRTGIAITVVVAVVAWASGGLMSRVDAGKRHMVEAAAVQEHHARELAMCRADNHRQLLDLERAKWDLTMCKNIVVPPPPSRTSTTVTPSVPSPSTTSSCKCAPNDPLCDCF